MTNFFLKKHKKPRYFSRIFGEPSVVTDPILNTFKLIFLRKHLQLHIFSPIVLTDINDNLISSSRTSSLLHNLDIIESHASSTLLCYVYTFTDANKKKKNFYLYHLLTDF